jgi:hypothetical protein
LGGEPLPHLLQLRGIFLHIRVADFPLEIDAYLHQLRRPREVTLLFQSEAEIPACHRLTAAVAKLAVDDKGLLVEGDGFARAA